MARATATASRTAPTARRFAECGYVLRRADRLAETVEGRSLHDALRALWAMSSTKRGRRRLRWAKGARAEAEALRAATLAALGSHPPAGDADLTEDPRSPEVRSRRTRSEPNGGAGLHSALPGRHGGDRVKGHGAWGLTDSLLR